MYRLDIFFAGLKGGAVGGQCLSSGKLHPGKNPSFSWLVQVEVDLSRGDEGFVTVSLTFNLSCHGTKLTF